MSVNIKHIQGYLNKKLSYRWQTAHAFKGQSTRSPNMVPFHMLSMVSY